ncbi:MAG: alpha/beta hydrolase, partial [Chloroflexi bacterium]|nr:alpha/beta hydrolase [Chloroflexota bacterium]
MPSDEYFQVVEAMQAQAASMIEGELSLEEQRAAMEEGFSFPLQDDISLTAADANGVLGEWTVLPGSDHNRRLLYVHGGGYVLGSIGTHRRLVADICRAAGCVALGLDYRLAPEHVFPAALDDAIRGLEYIWANGPVEPGEASSVFVGGDSAGGGLMLATLIAARDRGMRMPTGGIGLSPWADLAAGPEELSAFGLEDPTIPDNSVAIKASQGWAAMYAGDADRSDPFLSPVFADYDGICPLLLQAGSVEMICRDTERVAAKAREAGVEVV